MEFDVDTPHRLPSAVVFEHEVSKERLLQLLDHRAESDRLDYKETLDLSTKSAVLELAKDVGAFSALGGHIVVGAKDDGSPGALMDDKAWELFDAAKVTAKLANYLPERVRPEVARREIDGVRYAVLYVPPVESGLVVFPVGGVYKHRSGKDKAVFRCGDVFVRRGTSSTRWQQGDYEAALERVMQNRKDRWLKEHREVLEQVVRGRASQRLAEGPRAALSWTLDEATFSEVVVEQVRAGDLVPLTLMLQELPAAALTTLRGASALGDFMTILDRVALIGVLGVRLNTDGLVRDSVSTLRRLLLVSREVNEPEWRQEAAELEVMIRVYAIGGVAVRFGRLGIVRELAILTIPSLLADRIERPWIREVGVRAARANLLEGTEKRPYLLVRVHEKLRESSYATADLTSSHVEELLDSVLRFDLMACVAVLAAGDDADYQTWFPSFAYFYPHRVEPAMLAIIQNGDVRDALGVDPSDVSRIVRRLTRGAHEAARGIPGWRGWQSDVILQFLQ